MNLKEKIMTVLHIVEQRYEGAELYKEQATEVLALIEKESMTQIDNWEDLKKHTHRVGSHSDDWGGESDKICFCEIEKYIEQKITLAKAEGVKEALAKAREVLGVDEAYINLLTQEITTLEETKRQERKRTVEIVEKLIDGFTIDEEYYLENKIGLDPKIAEHYSEVKKGAEQILNFIKASLRAYIINKIK